jgi:flagellar FliJ protein
MAIGNPNRYDTLLRVRKRQEDIQAQSLAVARRDVLVARRQRSKLAQERQETFQHAGEMIHPRFDASEVRRFYQYARHLAYLGDLKDMEIRELLVVSEEKQKDLEVALKARRIVEKLKERKMAAFQKELAKQEQQAIDEVATNYAAIARALPTPTNRSQEISS